MLKKLVLLKNNQLYNKIIDILLFLFILSLFFPIRHVFLTFQAYLTGQYSDFTSFSLYLSDILLFTTCFLLFLPRGRGVLAKIKGFSLGWLPTTLLIIWLILGLILHFSSSTLFWTLKWLEFIVTYGTVKLVISEKGIENRIGQSLAAIFVSISATQSIIGLFQFYKQTSVGLYRLGEPHLSTNIDNVAKLIVNGKTYIRAYGTFPHSNLLAVFLVTAIIISIYLYLNSTWKWRIVWGIGIFLNILGLTVTFSRGAYLALALGLTIFFSIIIIRQLKHHTNDFKKVVMVMVIVIVSSISSFLLFRSFLLTRFTISDNAVSERVEYNNIGLMMIKDNPIFGLGAGESVLHMEQYSKSKLEPWQKQPIHNYFLLSPAELGLPGALLLIWIFLSHLKAIGYLSAEALAKEDKLRATTDFPLATYYLLLTTLLCSFLVLMLFDHYFYTLEQTQLLLWITLGIIASQTKGSRVEG